MSATTSRYIATLSREINLTIDKLTMVISLTHVICFNESTRDDRLLHLARQNTGQLCAALHNSRLHSLSRQIPVHFFHFNFMDCVLFLHHGLDGDAYRLHVWHTGFRDGRHLFSGRHFGARLLFLGARGAQRKCIILNNPMLTIETAAWEEAIRVSVILNDNYF